MKLTRKILKEMIEEVMLHEYGPAPARLRVEQKTPPAKKSPLPRKAPVVPLVNKVAYKQAKDMKLGVKNLDGISFIGTLATDVKGRTGIPEDLKTKMLNDLSGSKILEAMAGYKLVYGEPTDEVELIFVALFHLNRAIKQSERIKIKYGFNLLNYGGNYFTDVFKKISNRGRVILFDILRKAKLPPLSKLVRNPKVAKHLSRTSRRKTSIPRKKTSTPRKRVRKSASRYRNRAYVEAVQEIVNRYILTGKLSIPELKVDRSYGPKTRKGVEALQKLFKIRPADGWFGPATACAFSKKLGMTNNNCRNPKFIINLAKQLRNELPNIEPAKKPWSYDPSKAPKSMRTPYLPDSDLATPLPSSKELSGAYAKYAKNKRK